MTTRGEQGSVEYEQGSVEAVLARLHKARAARRGTMIAALLLAVLGPAVSWLRLAGEVEPGAWVAFCAASTVGCLAAAVLARRGRTKRAFALAVVGVLLVVTGDVLATASLG
ncbi:hypothetical protein ACFQVC_15600 [Streptomyces monticola]|uniref:Uncharacterized protein n=1 Tax=Streptomyces monticola TaxID=2666263 RepID=A0ABW2JJJ0_9ACTN